MINTNTYSNFKTYNQYLNNSNKNKTSKIDKEKLKALLGSSVGVAIGYLATKNIDMKKDHRILDELIHLLAMAGGANIGAVIMGSIGKKPDEIKKKIREGLFQIMNTSIPMLMVSAANAICNKTIRNTKPLIRVVASLAAMGTGAAIATKITNKIKPKKEEKRKYTIKDSIANIDDLIATFSIGFEEQADKLKLDTRLMPFIYAYCGMRAGAKE